MENKKVDTNKKFRKNIKIKLVIAIILLIAIALLNFFMIVNVHGVSMEPTFTDSSGTKLLALKNNILTPPVERGDIVIIDGPKYVQQYNISDETIIKRVIAIEGDHLVINDSHVYINGELMEEEYIKDRSFVGEIDIVIPQGEIFVLGDNRNQSIDSRYFGNVKMEDVLATVIYVFP